MNDGTLHHIIRWNVDFSEAFSVTYVCRQSRSRTFSAASALIDVSESNGC